MLTVLCFKWQSANGVKSGLYRYAADDVNRLRSMLERNLSLPHEVVCCTDDASGLDSRVRAVPLPAEVLDMGMEFPKLYAFHPDGAALFGERILMLDLDIVIVGSIDDIAGRQEPFIAWSRPAGSSGRFNTSVVLMDAGAFPEVWLRYDGQGSAASMLAAGLEGQEQDWVTMSLGGRGKTWPRDGEIVSYQARARRTLPPEAKIVCFNGRVAPSMPICRQESPWIAEHGR